jgi:hypothetical protein
MLSQNQLNADSINMSNGIVAVDRSRRKKHEVLTQLSDVIERSVQRLKQQPVVDIDSFEKLDRMRTSAEHILLYQGVLNLLSSEQSSHSLAGQILAVEAIGEEELREIHSISQQLLKSSQNHTSFQAIYDLCKELE